MRAVADAIAIANIAALGAIVFRVGHCKDPEGRHQNAPDKG